MKKISNIRFSQFSTILQSFNAPFLTMLSACIEYMDVKTSFATVGTACGTINSVWAEEDSQILGEPTILNLAEECAWVFDWQSRRGNTYRFGLQDEDNHYSYFVEYPENTPATMAAMIEFLALGTPIPEGWLSRYPYKDNAYLAQAVAAQNAKEKAANKASFIAPTKKRRGNSKR